MRRPRTERMRGRDWLILAAIVGGFLLAASGGFGLVPWWLGLGGALAAAVALAFAAAP